MPVGGLRCIVSTDGAQLGPRMLPIRSISPLVGHRCAALDGNFDIDSGRVKLQVVEGLSAMGGIAIANAAAVSPVEDESKMIVCNAKFLELDKSKSCKNGARRRCGSNYAATWPGNPEQNGEGALRPLAYGSDGADPEDSAATKVAL